MTSTDGFFTVRQSAWHGLGTVFQDYPSRATAQALAHPWEPEVRPIYRKVDIIQVPDGRMRFVVKTVDGAIKYESNTQQQAVAFLRDSGQPYVLEDLGVKVGEREIPIEGWVANVRDDNDFTLGVVTKDYNLVQNSRLWDIAEALENSGDDVMFETGGSLRGGAQVWILVRLKEPITIPGDPRGETIPYFALQNSHDGTGAFRGQATMTRIVCSNTSRIADMDAKARGTEFTFRHSSRVEDRIEEARTALAGWRLAVQDAAEMQAHLIQRQVVDGGVPEFLRRFIPMPPPAMASERTEKNVQDARAQWRECYQGFTGEGIDGTAYGLVQASIEYQEWCRKAHSAESRFKRSFLTKNAIVSTAVALALELSR
jgi:phage/plasmid-like protein (TIGR03299 family)